MKAINAKATKTLNKLVALAKDNGGHVKVDNTDGVYMAVSVEVVGECNYGPIISVAHYSESNGDLMADPEMTFALAADKKYYPLSFYNAYIGRVEQSVRIEGGKVTGHIPRQQGQHAVFAGQWMGNIKDQQGI